MYIPALPGGGMAGWSMLKRTEQDQLTRLNATAKVSRDREYAAEALSAVKNAEDLLSDRKLLEVVLTAYGLEDRINDRGLLRKVLEEGAASEDALANRLGDSDLKALADLFSFDEGNDPLSGAEVSRVLADYSEASLASAVAEQDAGLGRAYRARAALQALGSAGLSEKGTWYSIIGDSDLRKTFQTVLQLPEDIWRLDLDTQVGRLSDTFKQRFGVDVTAVTDPGFQEDIMDRYVAMDQIQAAASVSSAGIALSLLQSARGIDLSF